MADCSLITVKFSANLNRPSTRQMHALSGGLAKGNMNALSQALALVITECPFEGKPDDPQTYARLPMFGAFRDAVAWYREFIKSPVSPVDATFDLTCITANDFDQLAAQGQAVDAAVCVPILAKVVVSCSAMGSISEEMLWNAPYHTVFLPLLNAAITAVGQEMSHFLAPSTTG